MRTSLIALFLATATVPAFADDAWMVKPMQAGSIETESVNMVAYFVELPGNGYEVTATWLGLDDAEPSRMQMQLQDGDAVSFALPGHPETRFTFSRDVDIVTISTVPTVANAVTASL